MKIGACTEYISSLFFNPSPHASLQPFSSSLQKFYFHFFLKTGKVYSEPKRENTNVQQPEENVQALETKQGKTQRFLHTDNVITTACREVLLCAVLSGLSSL